MDVLEPSYTQANDLEAGDSLGHWFAVRVKSRTEHVVATIADNKGYQTFLPASKVRRRWSDRTRLVELPLFPGYLFCFIGRQSWLSLLTIPSVLGLVGVGKTPLPIDDMEIATLQATVQTGLFAEPFPFMHVGQLVRLEAGPLAGVEGFYIENRRQHRIVVSVTMLQRSVGIEIDRDWVRPLGLGNLSDIATCNVAASASH